MESICEDNLLSIIRDCDIVTIIALTKTCRGLRKHAMKVLTERVQKYITIRAFMDNEISVKNIFVDSFVGFLAKCPGHCDDYAFELYMNCRVERWFKYIGKDFFETPYAKKIAREALKREIKYAIIMAYGEFKKLLYHDIIKRVFEED